MDADALHQNFVDDVRRFSSGANFKSVQDDNTGVITNFVGLRRPPPKLWTTCRTCQHVFIAANTADSVKECYKEHTETDLSILIQTKESPFPFSGMPWGYFLRDAFYWKHLSPDLKSEIMSLLMIWKRLGFSRDIVHIIIEFVMTFEGRGIIWPKPCECWTKLIW